MFTKYLFSYILGRVVKGFKVQDDDKLNLKTYNCKVFAKELFVFFFDARLDINQHFEFRMSGEVLQYTKVNNFNMSKIFKSCIQLATFSTIFHFNHAMS